MFNKITLKKSSFIKGLGYDNGELIMDFGRGKKYKYNVDRETFIELLFAESKGKFYNQKIKKKLA